MYSKQGVQWSCLNSRNQIGKTETYYKWLMGSLNKNKVRILAVQVIVAHIVFQEEY